MAILQDNGLGTVGGKMATRMFVKICGITNRFDAETAIAAGADALGFNFWPGSRRYIDPLAAIGWIRDLTDEEDLVAVLVNLEISHTCRIYKYIIVMLMNCIVM